MKTSRSLITFFNLVHFQKHGEHHHYADVIRKTLQRHVERFAFDHQLDDLLKLTFVGDEDVARLHPQPYL